MEHDRLSARARGQLWLRLGIRLVMAVGCVLLFFLVICPLISFLLPFFLALLLAWALNPAVRWLKERLPMSRRTISLAVLLLALCAVGGVCFGLGWVLVGQLTSLMEDLPQIVESGYATFDAVADWLRALGEKLPREIFPGDGDLLDAAEGWLRGFDYTALLKGMAGLTARAVSALPSLAVAVIAFLMASYFITSDYPRMRFVVTEQLPAPLRRFGGHLRTLFMEAFGGYLRSQLILSGGVFLIIAGGFLLIRQPYGLLLALGLAVLDFIPLIGSGTVLVPWAAVALITSDYRGAVELLVIWGVVAVFRRVFEPRIIGDQTGLPPILSLVGIYAGMRIGGVVGMVLGPVLLLVAINLGKSGVFRPALNDLRLCARDLSAILSEGRENRGEEEPPGS